MGPQEGKDIQKVLREPSRRVTHKGQSQGGDHHHPLGQKQWAALGPKYRRMDVI